MESHASSPVHLVIQLAVILISSKLLGILFHRYLKLPRVLGEITAGIIIGPYALGALHVFTNAPLFPIPVDGFVISPELNGIVTVAMVVLMFIAGLETDAKQFIRLSGIATVVALGGFIVSYIAGAAITVLLFSSVDSLFHPSAMFWGVLASTTSVSITARILSDANKIATPEASTILASAVLDDVLGIVALAVIVGIIRSESNSVSVVSILGIAGRAFGFWIGTSIIGFLLAPQLIKGFKFFQSFEVIAGLTFGIALLLAGIAELVGLAMIIGAYITGLSLSKTDIAETLHEYLHGLYQIIVPVFFVNMGMVINFRQLGGPVFIFGILYSVVTIAAKIIGSGGFALFTGFNLRGALRIGWGMVPRGEVTLIIAGIALSLGAIPQEAFGVALLLLLISSICAPPMLSWVFKGKSGFRKKFKIDHQPCKVSFSLPSPSLVSFIVDRIVASFKSEEFFVNRIHRDSSLYQIKKDNILIILEWTDKEVILSTHQKNESLVRLILSEDLLELQEIIQSVRKSQDTESLYSGLLGNLFNDD